MGGLRWKIISFLYSLFNYDPNTKLKLRHLKNPETIGTEYGSWVIPKNFLNKNSICYLVGAGEDISFDVGVAEKYGSKVFVFDPTPKAIQHFKEFEKCILKNEKMSINNSSSEFYNLNKETLALLHFYELGLWKEETVMKFYSPKNPEHASYSISNIQKTENYIEARVDRLSSIMKKLRHSSIDLLKLDIDGAEYDVLRSIIEDRLDVKVICVEYDEPHFSPGHNTLSRIVGSLKSLMALGYVIADASKFCNYTLVRKDVYEQLN